MGGKHDRPRQRLQLCAAGLILLLLSSCFHVKEVERVVRVEQKSLHAEFLETLSDGADFDTAAKVNLDVLSHSPKKPPSDEALFNLGLIYAHARNPKKDYSKSLVYFRRMVREFPRSELVTEAEIWIGVLEDIARALRVDMEIEEKKKELAP